MKLKAFVTSLDEVDEKYRDCYVAVGEEGFKLDVDGITTHPEVTALSNAHNRTKTRVRELTTENDGLKAKVEDLPDDFDRDLYDRAVSEGVGGGGAVKNEAEIRREAAEAATNKANAAAKKDLDKANERANRLKARVERDARNAALDAALDEAKVTDPAYRAGARALLAANVKVHETDDDFEVLANDADLGDIPVAEYVKTWAQTDQGKAFVGARDSAGGGANGGGQDANRTTSDTNPFKMATLNITEQARMRRENPTLAAKLAKEAGVTLR